MTSSLKSLSQIWSKKSEDDELKTSRRQLSRQFNSASNAVEPKQPRMLLRNRSVLSSISNLNAVPKETRKLLQAGAVKVNQTFHGVCNTFGTCFQKLKNPTRRRERLINSSSPYTPNRTSPRTKLGRTPTKLYSPFGIETPSDRRQRNHQNFYGKPGSYTPTRNKRIAYMCSPTQALPKDVQHVREGVEDFNRAAEGVVRRSLRQQMSAAH